MVSSVAGFMVIPRASAYCATKHALEAITDGLRVRVLSLLLPWHMRCERLAPQFEPHTHAHLRLSEKRPNPPPKTPNRWS